MSPFFTHKNGELDAAKRCGLINSNFPQPPERQS